jgi:hypothetical protein
MPFPPGPLIPPAPLGPPPVPDGPPAPPPLTVGEKARHVAWFLGAMGGAGLLGYGGAWLGAHGVLGPGESCLVGGFGLLVGGSGLWALVPFYTEWQEARARRDHLDSSAADRADYALLTKYMARAWTEKYLGRAPADRGPTLRVMGVERPNPTDPAPADPIAADLEQMARDMAAWFNPDEVNEAGEPQTAVVDGDPAIYRPADPFYRAPEAANQGPDTERITTRLPTFLPTGAAWRYQPRQPYTALLRALVTLALETGSCTEPQAAAVGISGRQWTAACKLLGAAGVFENPTGRRWVLSDRVRRLQYDNEDRAIHGWIARRLGT